MPVQRVTRSIYGPSETIRIRFANIDPIWLQSWPYDTSTDGYVPVRGIRRLFEAYTPNSTKDHKVWKPFQHFKAETVYAHGIGPRGCIISADLSKGQRLSIATVFDERLICGIGTGFGQNGEYSSALDAWYVPQTNGDFIPVPSDLESLKKRGLQAMLPKIKSELSSLVSLYEIKDVLSLRGSIKNIIKLGRLAFTSIRGLAGRSLGSALAQGAADGYLQWMFNLKPLITDIGGIYRAVANYERRINDFVARSGTTQTAHYMCHLNTPSGVTEEPFGPNRYLGDYPQQVKVGSIWKNFWTWVNFKRRVRVDTAVFRSELQFNYSLSAFQREHAKVLGLLDMLGVNFNPAYVWNVLPWSFVLDWVIGIDQWLDQFEVKNLEPKVNILQYCWSIKKVRQIAVTARVSTQLLLNGTGSSFTQYIQLPEVRETSYRRGIDLPSASSFTTSGLSPTELSLGAALITTRRRRNTKRR